MEQLKVVELFGGIGAIRKALERQKFDFKVVDYVENNKFAVDSYNALFNEEYYPSSVVRYEIDMPCDFLYIPLELHVLLKKYVLNLLDDFYLIRALLLIV